MGRGIAGQKPFKMLVANLKHGSDPSKGESGNPQIIRKTYTTQNFIEVAGKGIPKEGKDGKTPGTGVRMGHLVQGNVAPTFTVVVNSAVGTISTTQPTELIMGDYVIVSHVDFVVVNGDVNTTATNLATTIGTDTPFTAIAIGDTVTVSLPTGLEYNSMYTKVTGPNAGDYTMSQVVEGEPYIGPAIIG